MDQLSKAKVHSKLCCTHPCFPHDSPSLCVVQTRESKGNPWDRVVQKVMKDAFNCWHPHRRSTHSESVFSVQVTVHYFLTASLEE